jgi:hypothetical protein
MDAQVQPETAGIAVPVKPARNGNGGRPRRSVDLETLRQLRAQGASWRAIEQLLGIPARTARRALLRGFAMVLPWVLERDGIGLHPFE